MATIEKIRKGLRRNAAVLSVAYVAAVMLVFWNGQRMQDDLTDISNHLLPASRLAGEAAIAFESMIKLYEAAILTGERALLGEAELERRRVEALLEEIAALDALTSDQQDTVSGLRKQFIQFAVNAQGIYSFMLAETVPDTVYVAGLEIARGKDDLSDAFRELVLSMSKDLQRRTGHIAGQARDRAGLIALLFFGIVLGFVIHTILRYHRISPEEITERIKTEQALRESEERMRTLFEHSPDPIFVEDSDGRVLAVNQAGAKLHKTSVARLIGRRHVDLVPPDDRDVVRENHRRWLAGEMSYRLAASRADDGTDIPVEVQAGPIQYAGQKALLLHVRNITERIEAERALRDSEARNRAIVSALPDLMFRFDPDGRYLDYHAGDAAQLYIAPEEFLWKTVFEVLPEEVAHPIMVSLQRSMQTGEMEILEYELSVQAGERRRFEARFVPCGDEEALAMIRDITDRQKLEEEQIKTEKLESLGLLAGGIAHDFNNLLTAILGNITLARRAAERNHNEADELLEQSENAALRARDLTQQLLTFARGGEPIKVIIRLNKVIRDAAEFILRGSNCQMHLRMTDDLWPTCADAGQLGQVIQNLVLNAEQAMPGGGTVNIHAENVQLDEPATLPLDPGPYVRITITDQGVGITPKHLENIFDPYFTTKQRGTGLGLPTCLSIIRKHGGHVTVESRVGQGSSFHVYLPADETTADTEGETSINAVAELRGRRILCMDDEKPIRRIVQRALALYACRVDVVPDGQEALRLYDAARSDEQPFDLVILDLTVPGGMGGKETLAALRKRDPSVKAIISSGYSQDPFMHEIQDDDLAAYLSKPFRIQVLIELVTKLLLHTPPNAV